MLAGSIELAAFKICMKNEAKSASSLVLFIKNWDKSLISLILKYNIMIFQCNLVPHFLIIMEPKHQLAFGVRLDVLCVKSEV